MSDREPAESSLHTALSLSQTRGSITVDQLLTIKQAAQLLSCSEAAIRKWIYQRRLPAVKMGRLTRLRAKDLEALVSRGLAGAPTSSR
jgi:excisionase family DNA binding protein